MPQPDASFLSELKKL